VKETFCTKIFIQQSDTDEAHKRGKMLEEISNEEKRKKIFRKHVRPEDQNGVKRPLPP
jgi:hypothetical protein